MKAIRSIASSVMILTIVGLHAATPVPAEGPVPQTGNVPGHRNSSGFRPGDSTQSLLYPAPAQFGSHGTFSAWINLDEPATASGPVFSTGTPDTGRILLQIGEGRLSFLVQRGAKPYVGTDECYVNLSAVITWAPDSWHHIAAVWDARGPNQSLVALFIDGQMVEERNTATLAEGWGPEKLFIGSNSANAKAPRIAGCLDNVAVFPFAVPPDQMTSVIGGDAAGAGLFVDFESGSDAQDLRLSSDDAAARAEALAKWPQ